MTKLNSLEVVKRYSKALFSLAKERAVLQNIEDELEIINSAIDANPEFIHLANSPFFHGKRQITQIRNIFKQSNLSEVVVNFICVLAYNSRLNILPQVIVEFKKQYLHYQNKEQIEFTTAQALTAEQHAEVTETLKKTFGKDVVIQSIVDTSILGGIVVKTGSTVFDDSLINKLKTLSRISNHPIIA